MYRAEKNDARKNCEKDGEKCVAKRNTATSYLITMALGRSEWMCADLQIRTCKVDGSETGITFTSIIIQVKTMRRI